MQVDESDESSNDEGENDGDSEEEHHSEDVEDSSAPLPKVVVLSKTWAIASAHVPIFTGGKFVSCNVLTNAEIDQGENHDDVNDHNYGTITSCLLVPLNGDVVVVDAQRGVKVSSIHDGSSSQTNNNNRSDDDDEDSDTHAITAFALSPNQSFVVTCTQKSSMQLFRFSKAGRLSMEKSWGRSSHSLPVTELEFHKSGVFVASGSVDGTVRIWDVRGGHVTHVYRPLAGGSGGGSGRLSVTSIQWMPDTFQLIIAIGRDDGSIAIHDLRAKEIKSVVVLREHMSVITSMQWWWQKSGRDNKDGHNTHSSHPSIFITAGRDAVVNLWQITSNHDEPSQQKLSSSKKRKNKRQSFSPAAAVPRYERLHTLPLYEQIEGLVVLPSVDGNSDLLIIATAGSKGVVRIWVSKPLDGGHMSAFDLCAQQPIGEAYGEVRGGYLGMIRMEMPMDASLTSSSQQQLVVADAENCLSFLSTSSGVDGPDMLTRKRVLVGSSEEILDLKFIPEKDATQGPGTSRIVVATNCAQVRIFDMEGFSCDVLDRHTDTVLCVDVSPCGRYIATSGKDKKMCLWQTQKQKCAATAEGHTEAVGATALSKKEGHYDVNEKAAQSGAGAFAVTASLDRTLKRWNLPCTEALEKVCKANEAPLALEAFVSVRAHEKDINVVSIAPNDSMVATGSQDKTVKLWRSTDLNHVATLKGHRRGVWDCQFSPYDRVVATASGDRSVRLWSLGDCSCVRTFQGHLASVLRVRFLNGGLQLVSSGADGLVKLWTIRTNECVATMDGHSEKVWALDVAPVSTTLVSGGADSKMLVWNDTTQQTEDEKRANREETLLLDQRLANHIRHKEFSEALDIALEQEKPRLVLQVLYSVVETDEEATRSPTHSLKQYATSWSMERVALILRYCREWNTRARNCDLAMLVIRAIVSVLTVEELCDTHEIPEIMAGVTPYAERHFDRLDGRFASSYLLEFALLSAGTLDKSKECSFDVWESKSKLVLGGPSCIEGKTQVGGQVVLGGRPQAHKKADSGDEVSTVGSSDSSESDGESSRKT